MSSEGDRRRTSVDKFMKKDMHGATNVSEKQEKHTRNKDRPDRGVWTPLRRAETSHTSDDHLSSSVSQRPQLLSDSVEGKGC
jgi:regulator of nonsense transcripts 3